MTKGTSGIRFVSPLRNFDRFLLSLPTACAVGCILLPLRGLRVSQPSGVKYVVDAEAIT